MHNVVAPQGQDVACHYFMSYIALMKKQEKANHFLYIQTELE